MPAAAEPTGLAVSASAIGPIASADVTERCPRFESLPGPTQPGMGYAARNALGLMKHARREDA
jgi:hypothetical protein